MSDKKRNMGWYFVKEYTIPVFVSLLILTSLLYAKVGDWPYTDPKGSLLSGQVFLETGSFVLADDGTFLPDYPWQLMQKDNDILYSYPIGTTLIHLPAIWVANACGMDMREVATEVRLNRILAALSVGILFFLIFRLNRRWNSYSWSFIVSLILVLGTGIYSTLGLALWNLNYFVIIALLVFSILMRKDSLTNPDTGWILGVLLFVGFAVRPSFVLCILVVFAYLLVNNFKQLIRAGFSSAALLLLFILFSVSTYGKIIPGSYNVFDFSEFSKIFINFAGHLISPSRGVLIFSPFLFVTIFAAVKDKTTWREYPFLKYLLGLVLCQLCFLSVWLMWWGGGGFGNRLSMELWPSLIIMTVVFSGPLLRNKDTLSQKLTWAGLILTGSLSIWIHVGQGANSQETVSWFHHPNKDQHPEYFWNIRFPQALATKKQIQRMDEWHWNNHLRKSWQKEIGYNISDKNLEFSNWSDLEKAEEAYRWTTGNRVSITARIPEAHSRFEEMYVGLDSKTYLDQKVSVEINGVPVGRIVTSAGMGRAEYRFGPLARSEANDIEIVLTIEEPKIPSIEEPETSTDTRWLGLCLYEVNIYSKTQ